jgi:hypothetical protein
MSLPMPVPVVCRVFSVDTGQLTGMEKKPDTGQRKLLIVGDAPYGQEQH